METSKNMALVRNQSFNIYMAKNSANMLVYLKLENMLALKKQTTKRCK